MTAVDSTAAGLNELRPLLRERVIHKSVRREDFNHVQHVKCSVMPSMCAFGCTFNCDVREESQEVIHVGGVSIISAVYPIKQRDPSEAVPNEPDTPECLNGVFG